MFNILQEKGYTEDKALYITANRNCSQWNKV